MIAALIAKHTTMNALHLWHYPPADRECDGIEERDDASGICELNSSRSDPMMRSFKDEES